MPSINTIYKFRRFSMASPIAYLYEPEVTVWIITPTGQSCPSAVKEGVVVQVRANVLSTSTTILYDIRLSGNNGALEFKEADIFATLSAAVTEYETRLT